MKLTAELYEWMDKFEECFETVVPLRQIPLSVTDEELIMAIKECIKKGENLLPKIFGYGKNDGSNLS